MRVLVAFRVRAPTILRASIILASPPRPASAGLGVFVLLPAVLLFPLSRRVFFFSLRSRSSRPHPPVQRVSRLPARAAGRQRRAIRIPPSPFRGARGGVSRRADAAARRRQEVRRVYVPGVRERRGLRDDRRRASLRRAFRATAIKNSVRSRALSRRQDRRNMGSGTQRSARIRVYRGFRSLPRRSETPLFAETRSLGEVGPPPPRSPEKRGCPPGTRGVPPICVTEPGSR